MPESGRDTGEEAQARLRERLGKGARYDAPAAPHRELSWARRGTAYFARKLNELADRELDAPSRVPGWSRRHVIAHIGYQARKLSRLVEAARKGLPAESLPESEPTIEDVAFGATLPAYALRHLFAHAAVHLNVEWRDLHDAGWDATVRSIGGQSVRVRETPLLRAREIWRMAIALDNGGRQADCPEDLRPFLRPDDAPSPG